MLIDASFCKTSPIVFEPNLSVKVSRILSATHSECNEAELADQGIAQNTVRLSIGVENVDDIIEDLSEAFGAVLN